MIAGVSIVICTYNGAKLLPKTLQHIAAQEVRPDVPWEVIVVDNASTDTTASVVREEWKKQNNRTIFSLLHQPKPGLTFARELAFAHARYNYILLCDDDNWLGPDYVNIAYDLMEQHPMIGALGGYGELVYEQTPPYFATQVCLFAHGHQAERSGKVSKNTVHGAGCVIRKSAYVHLLQKGYQPLLTDRLASTLSSGGDYELCFGLAMIGYDIWYDDRLIFKHFMVKERQNWDYYQRYLKESIACFEVLDAYNILVTESSRTELTFNYRLFRGFLFYLHELTLQTLQKINLDPSSEEGKANTLRVLGSRARLSGYRNYFKIRKNFLYLLRFTNNQVQLPSPPLAEPSHTSQEVYPTAHENIG